MKKLVLLKSEAQPLVEFLQELELKNKVSRLRNKFIKKLAAIQKEVEEDRVELAKEHSKKDEEGEPVTVDEQFEIEDQEAFAKELNELFLEEVAIDSGEYSNNFKPLFDYLDSEEFDMPLSGIDANRYDRLLDIWEEAEGEDK